MENEKKVMSASEWTKLNFPDEIILYSRREMMDKYASYYHYAMIAPDSDVESMIKDDLEKLKQSFFDWHDTQGEYLDKSDIFDWFKDRLNGNQKVNHD